MVTKTDSNQVARNPPNDATQVEVDLTGVKVRLSRWATGAIVVLVIVLTGLLLLWMSPEDAVTLISAFSRR